MLKEYELYQLKRSSGFLIVRHGFIIATLRKLWMKAFLTNITISYSFSGRPRDDGSTYKKYCN